MDFELVALTLEDLSELIEISKTTYRTAFAKDNTVENMESYLKRSFNREKMKKELMDNNSKFFFAKSQNETTGYLKLNFGNAQTDFQADNAMEIERIYVLEKFQGVGIGQFLINNAIRIAKNNTATYVWLGVWEKNRKAIRFYEKNDFIIMGAHPFKMGNEIQTDYILQRKVL